MRSDGPTSWRPDSELDEPRAARDEPSAAASICRNGDTQVAVRLADPAVRTSGVEAAIEDRDARDTKVLRPLRDGDCELRALALICGQNFDNIYHNSYDADHVLVLEAESSMRSVVVQGAGQIADQEVAGPNSSAWVVFDSATESASAPAEGGAR